MQPYPEPRRRRWPLLLIAFLVLVGGLWTGAWYYAAGKVETTIAGWKQREARSGRVYSCSSQTIGGFPFAIQVRCADAGAELTTASPPVSIKAKDMLVSAQVWQPTVLTTTFVGPMTIADPQAGSTVVANWRSAQSTVHGSPANPERVEIVLDEPVFDRVDGAASQNVFKASRVILNGRMLEGSATGNPVIEIALKLSAGSAPTLHPAAAIPLDADVTAVLRGLKDFAPKPWPQRFRELQAAGGRIEVTRARLQQGEAIATAQGALGLSPRGQLDGLLQLTIANLEKVLPAFGLDRMTPPQDANPRLSSTFNKLDRIAPGLGSFARQNAAPALVAGLAFLGRPTELEGQRAYVLPLRFTDGAAALGPIPLGQTPPLF